MGAGVGAGAEIRAGTWLGPEIELHDRAGEVLPKWGPPTGPGSLASSSSTKSLGRGFRRGERQEERQGREPLGAISKIDLIIYFFF